MEGKCIVHYIKNPYDTDSVCMSHGYSCGNGILEKLPDDIFHLVNGDSKSNHENQNPNHFAPFGLNKMIQFLFFLLFHKC